MGIRIERTRVCDQCGFESQDSDSFSNIEVVSFDKEWSEESNSWFHFCHDCLDDIDVDCGKIMHFVFELSEERLIGVVFSNYAERDRVSFDEIEEDDDMHSLAELVKTTVNEQRC